MNAKYPKSRNETQPNKGLREMACQKMQPLWVATLARREGSKTSPPTALKRGLLEPLINGLAFFFLYVGLAPAPQTVQQVPKSLKDPSLCLLVASLPHLLPFLSFLPFASLPLSTSCELWSL